MSSDETTTDHTTISISRATRDQLRAMKPNDETWDSFLTCIAKEAADGHPYTTWNWEDDDD